MQPSQRERRRESDPAGGSRNKKGVERRKARCLCVKQGVARLGQKKQACTAFRERRGRFDELLLSDVPLARQALRKLLAGRIEFHPEERDGKPTYRLRWALTLKPSIDEGYIGVASPRGFEPRLPP